MIKLVDRPSDGFYPAITADYLRVALCLFGERHPRSVSIAQLSDHLLDDEDEGLTSGVWDHLQELGLIRFWLDRGVQTAHLTEEGYALACVEREAAAARGLVAAASASGQSPAAFVLDE